MFFTSHQWSYFSPTGTLSVISETEKTLWQSRIWSESHNYKISVTKMNEFDVIFVYYVQGKFFEATLLKYYTSS